MERLRSSDGGGLSKHSASAISEPVFPLNRNSAVAFHPFSVSKGSKDLIMTEP